MNMLHAIVIWHHTHCLWHTVILLFPFVASLRAMPSGEGSEGWQGFPEAMGAQRISVCIPPTVLASGFSSPLFSKRPVTCVAKSTHRAAALQCGVRSQRQASAGVCSLHSRWRLFTRDRHFLSQSLSVSSHRCSSFSFSASTSNGFILNLSGLSSNICVDKPGVCFMCLRGISSRGEPFGFGEKLKAWLFMRDQCNQFLNLCKPAGEESVEKTLRFRTQVRLQGDAVS